LKKQEIIDLLNKDLTGEIEEILISMRDSFITPQYRPSIPTSSMKKRNTLKNLPNN
jgi:hypothetical protein